MAMIARESTNAAGFPAERPARTATANAASAKIPAMVLAAKGENPLLGARLLLVPAGAAKGGIEAETVQGLL